MPFPATALAFPGAVVRKQRPTQVLVGVLGFMEVVKPQAHPKVAIYDGFMIYIYMGNDGESNSVSRMVCR